MPDHVDHTDLSGQCQTHNSDLQERITGVICY